MHKGSKPCIVSKQTASYLTSTMLQNIYTLLPRQLLLNQENNKLGKSPARSLLKRGQSTELLEQIQGLSKKVCSERCRAMIFEIHYFTKFHLQGRLSYSLGAAMKMPIGSGAIESLIRQVVNLRLKGNGKFWLQGNTEAILHARCQWAAITWSTFCDSLLTARLYPV